MQAVIRSGKVQGTIKAPASKSMMQRACAAALLHKGKTIIQNPGTSEDDMAALSIIQQLGATIISQSENKIEISSNGIAPIASFIDCSESGLSARLFIPIAVLSDHPINIRGKGSLLNRPMNVFEDVLPLLNVALSGFNGYLPFTVTGPLKVIPIKVDGSISSQFLSGLLFAFAYSAGQKVTIEVTDLKSRPYIDLTLSILQQFGKPILHDNYQFFHIDPTLFEQKETVEINIEGDWSSAACMMVAGAIAGEITINNLNINSVQADKVLLKILQEAGANMSVDNNSITAKATSLTPFEFDATHCPDLFPVLAVLAACCNGESYITGLHRLFHKESNRAESIAEMLQQFGVSFSIEDDTLCIYGEGRLNGATIDAYGDHRIVMAAAVGALRARGAVVINGAESVNKSYPGFFKHLISLGVACTLNDDEA